MLMRNSRHGVGGVGKINRFFVNKLTLLMNKPLFCASWGWVSRSPQQLK